MNTENLRTFLLLGKLKNFTEVAKRQFVAQSTVTNRIAELEREAGVKLFVRNRRNVALTEEGRVFSEYARRICEMEEACKQAVKKGGRRLRIGATNAVYESALKAPLFEALGKGEAYSVTLSHSAELLQMLSDGLLDAAYCYQPYNKAGFLCTPFFQDELALLVRADRNGYPRGIRREELPELDCAICNFALPEIGAYVRELFPAGHAFAFEIDNSSKVLDYLEEGLGYAFLPRGLAEAQLKSGLFAQVRALDFKGMSIPSFRICRREDADVLI